MSGGAGNDVYVVDSRSDRVTEFSGQGVDDVQTTLTFYELGANVENLTGSDASQTLIGNALDNIVRGGGGVDYLDGGAGNDQLFGGAGDDVYTVRDAGDLVIEQPGEGRDQVRTSLASYTLGANVEDLIFTGTTGASLTGNDLGNAIEGGSGADALFGGVGDDTLRGRGGNDRLEGGNGSDTAVFGGARSDYRIERTASGYQVIDLRTGSPDGTDLLTGIETLAFSDKTESISDDEVRTDLAEYSIAGMPEVTKLTGIGPFAQTLTGNDRDNIIDGGGGFDLMIGGLGDDTYIVDQIYDGAVERAGEGRDTVRTTLAAWTLEANVEDLVGLNANGAALTGNAENNRITGSVGADRLAGGAGDDILDGGNGVDTAVFSGARADYLVEQLGSGYRVTDKRAGAEGADTLANIEQVSFSDGTFDVATLTAEPAIEEVRTDLAEFSIADMPNVIKLTGVGPFQQRLTGNAQANMIDGGPGFDVMIGGLGDDTYIVDQIYDGVIELAGEGRDLVRTSLSAWTLEANVEDLVGSNTGGAALTGNALANSITGNVGADTLKGASGDDVLDGAGGEDTAVFSGARSQYLIERTGSGYRVTDTRTGAVSDGVDTLVNIEMASFSDGSFTLTDLLGAEPAGAAADGAVGQVTMSRALVGMEAVGSTDVPAYAPDDLIDLPYDPGSAASIVDPMGSDQHAYLF